MKPQKNKDPQKYKPKEKKEPQEAKQEDTKQEIKPKKETCNVTTKEEEHTGKNRRIVLSEFQKAWLINTNREYSGSDNPASKRFFADIQKKGIKEKVLTEENTPGALRSFIMECTAN